MHRIFYEHLPVECRRTTTGSGSQRVTIVPGSWRDCPEIARIPEFLTRFAEAYQGCPQPHPHTSAASHQRLAWIHAFVDGNGRVARLLTDSLVEHSGLGAAGLWCVGRGFARTLESYRSLPTGLDRWCAYVLEIMLVQFRFMHGLIRPADLRLRIATWAERETARDRLRPRTGRLIAEVICTGSVSRTDAVDILRLTDR